jgi:hypothetical protein
LDTQEYTDEDMEWQRWKGWRPWEGNIRHVFWAEHEDESWHWVRETQTWDLPSLFSVHGSNYTAKELWDVWMNMPLVQNHIVRGDRVPLRKKKMEDYLQQKAATRDLLDHFGLPQPKTKSEWRIILKQVGRFLAAKTFLSRTPQTIMELPVQEGHDDIEHLRLRAVCDDSIHVPLDMLRGFPELWEPFQKKGTCQLVTIRHFWRCNHKIQWTQEVLDPELVAQLKAKDAGTGDGVPVAMEVEVHEAPPLPASSSSHQSEAVPPRVSHMPPPSVSRHVCKASDNYKKANGFTKQSNVWWFEAECGLILSSVTPWEVKTQVKGETRGGYVCRHCQGFWKPGQGGGRFLQISDGTVTLQAIVDEPPGTLYAKWIKSRVEWYKRILPRAPLTDERPNLAPPASNRLRFSESLSNALWEIVLSNPEEAALQSIERLATLAVSKEASTGSM